MLSKNQIKYIRSLHAHKFRQIHRQYLVEGEKMIKELLESEQKIEHIYALESWLDNYHAIISKNQISFTIINNDTLEKISALHTPNRVVAIVHQQNNEWDMNEKLSSGIYVVADNIKDPGNLGTMIRTADWFGAKAVFCSRETAELYNPKVVQASMGSVFKMPVYYVDIQSLLVQNTHYKSYAAALNGSNVYQTKMSINAILLIGNESKGISEDLLSLCSEKIAIPQFGKAESLNAAVACGVLLGLIRR